MPTITFQGQSCPVVSQDKMTPGEIDAVERVTGLTLQKIRRMGETCVCEHGLKAHEHKDPETGEQTKDTSCASCDCEQHQADVPMRVSTAFMWVSVKRAVPTVKFSDVSDASLDELDISDDEEPEGEADPTEPPPVAA